MGKKNELKRPNGMGCITYLGKNRRKPWAVRVTDGIDKLTGKQTRRYIGYYATETEAKKALAMHYANPVLPQARTTLKQLYEEWQPGHYSGISKQQQDCYNAAWIVFAPLYNRQFAELRAVDFQAVIDGSGLGYSSRQKMRGLYSLLCKYAMENDIINKNYAQFIRMGKDEKKEKEIFTDAEIRKIEKAAEKDIAARYILIMIYTGFRIEEFLALTPFDVDMKNKTMRGGVKTEAGKNRIIPIHPKIILYIAALYNEKKEALIHKEDGSRYSVNYFRDKMYYPALENLGIPKRSPHCTRHTFATNLVRAKAPPTVVQRLLGHTKYSFTVDTYVHNNALAELAAAVGKMQ